MASPQPSLQFEVPPSADTPTFHHIPPASASSKRPFSIDLSLELERQLDMESLPPTPAHNATSLPHSASAVVSALKHDSLDPQVLAHIVTQLRQSLTDMTKERDDLVALLSSAHSHEAELEDALQHMTDKATGMEEELTEARKKMKDDEEAISMLRSKVEESRRGLMRLQTENRRHSAISPLDLSRAGLPHLAHLASPPSSKRASFTPLTGSYASRPNAHRRISSVSDSGLSSPTFGLGGGRVLSDTTNALDTSPNSQTLTLPSENPSSQPPVSAMRFAGLFGRANGTSPPQEGVLDNSAEVQALRKELTSVKNELEETRHELSEAVEAREASDTCVKTLREFIEENNVGSGGSDSASVKLPPLPAYTTGDEGPPTAKPPASGWGFKLWKVDTTKPAGSGPASVSANSPVVPSPSAQAPTPTQAAPLSRKLGGFFSRQSSVSSVSVPTPPSLQDAHRASMYSYESRSDASSIAEPISPAADADDNVVVRDASSSSSPSELVNVALEEQKGPIA